MSRPRIAHRAEFSVRCACGITYNTDDAHVGKQIKCRCGRTLTIARPAEDLASSDSPTTREARHRVVRSVQTWMLNAVHEMASRRPRRRWTARLCWAWMALMVITWLLLVTTSESFLPAMLLAYGPRFVVLLPLTVLVPAALILVRSALVPLAIAAFVTLGPIMGGRVSWRTVGR